MDINSKIYVAGHTGLVGSAVLRELNIQGYNNIITISSKNLDLRNQQKVDMFFSMMNPEYVFLCAGTVGGIVANNTRGAEFIYDNTMIQTNIINASYNCGVKKLLVLGSSCIYPRESTQPICEKYLLSGILEPTNEPYAVSKINALKMTEAYRKQYGCNFISAMPTNLYGINDNYDLENSHVLPALIRKIYEAKINNTDVVLWGSGKPRREFMLSYDVANALLFLMKNYNESGHINVGVGEDISIYELSQLVSKIVGFEGKIIFDSSKPDGTLKKLLNVDKLHNLGWRHSSSLEEGIKITFEDFKKNYVA